MFSKPDKIKKADTVTRNGTVQRGIMKVTKGEWKTNNKYEYKETTLLVIGSQKKKKTESEKREWVGWNRKKCSFFWWSWLTGAPVQTNVSSQSSKTCQQSWAHKCRVTGGRFTELTNSGCTETLISPVLCPSSKQKTIKPHASHNLTPSFTICAAFV